MAFVKGCETLAVGTMEGEVLFFKVRGNATHTTTLRSSAQDYVLLMMRLSAISPVRRMGRLHGKIERPRQEH